MQLDKNEILQLVEELFPFQIKLRRQFHQYPEISDKEFHTTKLIKSELSRQRIMTRNLKMKTGAIGIINGRKKRAVAIRSDIDALPIKECTNLPFKSKNEGVMHACGHDIHMAVVLGTAFLLNRLKDKLPGCVKFIFQPAEESPPGGAQRMIEEGALESPDAEMIFGLHVDSTVKTGKISLRDGPTMASVMDFDITILGKGGHAAIPHRAVDAIAAASEVVGSVQKIVSREISPMKPVLITVGSIHGGNARNAIADKVLLSGTIRTLAPENMKLVPRLIKRTVAGICQARGAKYKIDFFPGYPVLSNHEQANRILESAFTELYGRNLTETTPQTMGGEDFSFYLKKVRGAMFRLGIKNNRMGANKPWHSPAFVADEKSIFYGTALLSLAVFRFFEGA